MFRISFKLLFYRYKYNINKRDINEKNNIFIQNFVQLYPLCLIRNETKGSVVLFIKSTRKLKEIGNIKNNYTRNLPPHSSRNAGEERKGTEISYFINKQLKEFNIENGGWPIAREIANEFPLLRVVSPLERGNEITIRK